jgi:hypothetical protein
MKNLKAVLRIVLGLFADDDGALALQVLAVGHPRRPFHNSDYEHTRGWRRLAVRLSRGAGDKCCTQSCP